MQRSRYATVEVQRSTVVRGAPEAGSRGEVVLVR